MSILDKMIEIKNDVRNGLYTNFTETALKLIIIGWCIFVIVLVLFFVNSKWALAGILAYEVLP